MVRRSLSRTALNWLLALTLALFVSCGSEKKEWEQARATDTLEAFTAFLKSHPQSEFSDQAFTRLQELNLGWSFKIVLACQLNRVVTFGQTWEIKDRERNKGVAILLEVSGFDPAKGIYTTDLFAGYEIGGKTLKSLCKGIGLGAFISKDNPEIGAWFIGKEGSPPGLKGGVFTDAYKQSKFYKEIWLLYGVPIEVKKLTMLFHDVQISSSFPIGETPKPAPRTETVSTEGADTSEESDMVGTGLDDGVVPKSERPAAEPAKVPEEKPIRAVGAVKPPTITKRVEPDYPVVAKSARVSGDVVLEVVTNKNGRVRECRVIKGHPLLNDAALRAVRQWEFEPVIVGGKTRSVIFMVTVKFILPE